MKVAIQGQKGSFHDAATRRFFDENNTSIIPCDTFAGVFRALKADTAEVAVVAVENSLYGSIREVHDLLLAHHYPIVGEVILHIHQQLIGHPETKKQNIKEIISHPVALDQCRDYLEINFPEAELVEHHDTAGAVDFIKIHGLKNAAAIASEVAAELHGMSLIDKDIEDEKANFTRFVVLQKKSGKVPNADKASLVLVTPHQPGSLYDALGIFAKYKVNLTKLESRPIRGKIFHYQFFIDADANSDQLALVIEDLEAKDCKIVTLGHYKASS